MLDRATSLQASLARLPTFDPMTGDLLAVIETPKGSRSKYAFNQRLQVFELKTVLPRGMLFPYDFGFIPSTKGSDGDPLDVLLLLEDAAPMGCMVRVRAIGAIQAEQREKNGEWLRNDRLVAVATGARLHGNADSLKDLNPRILDEVEAFFCQYNQLHGKEFKPLRRCGPKAALKLVREGMGSSE
jgi:inorganic pyrophosphatase